jgi:hypothetical protein
LPSERELQKPLFRVACLAGEAYFPGKNYIVEQSPIGMAVSQAMGSAQVALHLRLNPDFYYSEALKDQDDLPFCLS